MKSTSNEQLHSTKYKKSIARQIVCCKCTARHHSKVGLADIMVELSRNTYYKYRMKVSLNEQVYVTKYRKGHTRHTFLCIMRK